MPPPPPALPDELIEEVFLRLPPDEPACLVRASLASKLWFGLLIGPIFCSRYREFHGTPPMLGFFYSHGLYYSSSVEEEPDPLFVSTTKFGACIPDHDHDEDWCYSLHDAWDCRHGRVVIGDRDALPAKLVVLDPMTGDWRELAAPEDYDSYGAAVLCNVTGCDHLGCHKEPFQVVVVGMDIGDSVAHVYVSLQGPGELYRPISQWSKPCPGLHIGSDALIQPMPPVLIQDTLYFMLLYDDDDCIGILKYDLCSQCLSLIDAPFAETDIDTITILMGMKDGSLGFAHLDGLNLNLWSRQMGSDGVGSWTECRVIDLNEFLPIQNPEKGLRLMGSSEGRDIIFVSTDLGIYEINLKSLEWKKIWNRRNFHALIPYMSFYRP
uniref:Uncharacterized protein n=1 Tax=Avena sativa TaxID=4498 RepID=A0ACD5VZA6_AVESA